MTDQLTCKACGKPLSDNPYSYTAHELLVREWGCTPDGTARVHHIDAGTFCSTGCMMLYLMRQTGLSKALDGVKAATEDMKAALTVLTDHAVDGDLDRSRASEIEKSRREQLASAWAEVERILLGEARLP